MTTARDLMRPGAQWIFKRQTVTDAARIMAAHGLDALVVADENDRMCGIITYRDIVLRCVAANLPPDRTTAGMLCHSGTPRWVDSKADAEEVVETMNTNRVEHLPVVEDRRLIGTIGERDLARYLDDQRLGEFTRAHVGGDRD